MHCLCFCDFNWLYIPLQYIEVDHHLLTKPLVIQAMTAGQDNPVPMKAISSITDSIN